LKKYKWVLFTNLVVLPLLIAGCGPAATEPVTITPPTTPLETPTPSTSQSITSTQQTTPQTPVQYNLTVSVNPLGGGAVSGVYGPYKPGDKVYITATPYTGYAFDHWSGDVSANGSTLVLLMNSDKALVANFIDIAPPVISNVTLDVTDTKATIIWDTSEPATSQVEYGLASDYGLKTSGDDQLTGKHIVILTGLQPDTVYQYRIQSVDKSGNGSPFTEGVFNTKTRGAAVTGTISRAGNGVTYSITNTSSLPIKVVSADLLDKDGITRHSDESTEVGVPYMAILSPGNSITKTYGSTGQTYSGWHVIWYCKDINYVVELPFNVASNTLP
jgi:hypothetical protein